MSIVISDIDFNKEATSFYRDKYNDQCQCRECVLFRNKFSKNYPMIDAVLSDLGVNIYYPLEIMDNGISSVNLKRNYSAYYCVKGILPYDKIEDMIQGVSVTLRNWNIADESYSNTGMIAPYFIIELANIFISDNKHVITDALSIGREIEFHFNGKNYFMSHNNEIDWYIYCQETKEEQHFRSDDKLLLDAVLDGKNINDIWEDIIIDYIL